METTLPKEFYFSSSHASDSKQMGVDLWSNLYKKMSEISMNHSQVQSGSWTPAGVSAATELQGKSFISSLCNSKEFL